MKRLAWFTDIHLNFLDRRKIRDFCRTIVDHDADAVLVSGDIGDALTIRIYLRILEDELHLPIYFVLGNHDFYHGSINGVRAAVQKLSECSDFLHWLPAKGVVKLTTTTCLIGIDSWADGRLGDYEKSDVMLNDYLFVEELSGLDQIARRRKLNEFGDHAAVELKSVLPKALEYFKHVILLSHVPPFKEACWHAGNIAHDHWLPHFSCKAAGEVLMNCMYSYHDRKMTVLCGHTHSGGFAQVLPNLYVKTGAAEYGSPRLQELLSING